MASNTETAWTIKEFRGEDGFGWVIRIRDRSEISVDFECYEVITFEQDGAPLFENYDWQKTGDWTKDFDDAAPQISGFVKWDGCCEMEFGNRPGPDTRPDGNMHFCGKDNLLNFTVMMNKCFYVCRDRLKELEHWDGE